VSLAAELMLADVRLADIKTRVEALLTGLFPSWEHWDFVKPDGIAVWPALDSERAVEVLYRHGFGSITLHNHSAKKLITCTCRTHEI
jgi:hypothetical protein